MKLKVYVLDLEIPRRTKQRILLGFAALGGLALLVGGGALVWAGPITDSWITDGGEISSSKLQGNLTGLQDQIDALQTAVDSGRAVVTINGKLYSVGATKYGNVTTTLGPYGNGKYSGNDLGSYAGAKAVCETLLGSLSAHMCTAEELVRSAQAGMPIAAGWYSTGARNTYSDTGETWDCSGWGDQASQDWGPWWSGTGPGLNRCDTADAAPVLCCD